MRNERTKKITGISIFASLVIVLQLIGNYISIGQISITLALFPIAMGAIIYGPLEGMFLGFIQGIIVIFAPSTMATFMPFSVIGTIVVCLLKGGLAGLTAGYIYKLFKNINLNLAIIMASIIVPIVNTGLFTIACFTIFLPKINELFQMYGSDSTNLYAYFFLSIIGINFIIEFIINSCLSPTIIKLTKLKENLY